VSQRAVSRACNQLTGAGRVVTQEADPQQVTDVALLASNFAGRLENSLVLQGFSNLVAEYAE